MLEPIFEADFLPCSHGFRQGHSTHTALRSVVRLFPRVTWTIEGDISGCYDNIPHHGLMRAVQRRIADQEVLALIKRFLKAGYMEDWRYHQTYSGTPQGGIASPLLCNIFLHHLDDYVVNTLGANRLQIKQESNRRRNPAYRRIDNTIQQYRRKLKRNPSGSDRRVWLQKIETARKELRRTPIYDKRHGTKLGYVRYADDWALLVNGTKQEAEHIKAQIGEFFKGIGLELSEEKTKLTHWSEPVAFLGYHIRGMLRSQGNQIRAVLSIPPDRERRIRREIIHIARRHHIPELDAMLRMNAMFRGWCNYYRYANAPQEVFNRVASKVWWYFAHFRARKERTSIQKMLVRAQKAGRYRKVKHQGRLRQTFTIKSGKKEYSLNVFPPRTQSIHQVKCVNWEVDLKPVHIPGWQVGRSLQTRLTALTRSDGLCECCHKNPAAQAHHKVRMKTKKTLVARVRSDKDQEQTAKALCKACHLEFHHGHWKG
jgi:group II intron reverse transcriptase/maturase